MRLWRKRAVVDENEDIWRELRAPVGWCDGCRVTRGPFIYFQNDKHYCRDCAAKAYAAMGLRSAGKRTDDIQYP